MGLSLEQKKWLKARYDVWGIDRVREELRRADRDLIAHPDVTAFAEGWIEGEESSHRRTTRCIVALAIVGAVQLGIAVALMVGF
jgi:hypothetical protein